MMMQGPNDWGNIAEGSLCTSYVFGMNKFCGYLSIYLEVLSEMLLWVGNSMFFDQISRIMMARNEDMVSWVLWTL
jgi:hypothetical protein